MPKEAPPQAGQRIGPYLTADLIGDGGFAWVLAASRDGVDEVALKVLKPKFAGDRQFTTRFLNEAETAGELRHPNIVRILDMGEDREWVYYAMPLHRTTLEGRLREQEALDELEVARTARDIAAALAFAHETGLVHRDIKPQNILYGADGAAILSDFGIARAVAGYVSTTGKRLVLGTPHFVSPEQAKGLPLDGRTDIYALGVTMYRATTGRLPFRSSDWYELARLHVEEPPEPLRDQKPAISREFERIVLTCLAKDREERYATAGSLADDLDALLEGARASKAGKVISAARRILRRG